MVDHSEQFPNFYLRGRDLFRRCSNYSFDNTRELVNKVGQKKVILEYLPEYEKSSEEAQNSTSYYSYSPIFLHRVRLY